MSLRRVDLRFVLPSPPRRAVVLGGLDDWRRGLEASGVDVVASDARGADLVVAPRALAAAAHELEPEAVIVEGRPGAPSPAYTMRRYLPRPSIDEPALLLPLEHQVASAYAVRRWSVVDRRWKRWRRTAAAALLERGLSLPLQETVSVGARNAGEPYFVTAAMRELEVVPPIEWVLTLGQGDTLSRNVFHVFAGGETVPAVVVKFARVAQYVEPFDRDERGLALAAAAGERAGRRAPRLLRRFAVDGVHASVESAAVGARLRELLQDPGSRGAGRSLVDDVAAWIIELGRASAEPPEALAAERRRLAAEVVSRWTDLGASTALVNGLPPLPAVTQHNDLGSWNIIVDGRDFTAVDWESARPRGLPLWDLLYFLADALALLDGESSGERRHEHMRRLFGGELASSEVLFAWVRRAVAAFQIPSEAVGPLATLCWLHHSLSHVDRSRLRAGFGDLEPAPVHGLEWMAEAWLADSALGPAWSRWQRG